MASEHINDTFIDITTKWSIDDAANAHDMLDYFDALQDEADKNRK